RVLDVVVEHDVYGQLHADLNLNTLHDVELFCDRLQRSSSGPLFPISAGIHLHTVEAESEDILDQIEDRLQVNGYLLSPSAELA
ncbi:MAG: DNA-binding transcriptional regulator, partial [Anaerotignum sp.]|nr:DNA-binding transcriptional regulator [Anaerotignum sp.]